MADTDVPAPVFLHFASGVLFQIDVGIGVVGQVEVGADAEFNPAAAQVFRKATRSQIPVTERVGRFAVKVVHAGNAHISETPKKERNEELYKWRDKQIMLLKNAE